MNTLAMEITPPLAIHSAGRGREELDRDTGDLDHRSFFFLFPQVVTFSADVRDVMEQCGACTHLGLEVCSVVYAANGTRSV